MEAPKSKPTIYRGVTFRSRLEARWAVFLDHHFMVRTWSYEPYEFTFPESGWRYTPDFGINIGGTIYLLEVKPAMPTEEYKTQLTRIAEDGHHIWLGVGSFYQSEEPRLFDYTNTEITTVVKPILLSNWPLFPSASASVKQASQFRFDLAKGYIPKNKLGNDQEFRQHLRDYTRKTKRENRDGPK